MDHGNLHGQTFSNIDDKTLLCDLICHIDGSTHHSEICTECLYGSIHHKIHNIFHHLHNWVVVAVVVVVSWVLPLSSHHPLGVGSHAGMQEPAGVGPIQVPVLLTEKGTGDRAVQLPVGAAGTAGHVGGTAGHPGHRMQVSSWGLPAWAMGCPGYPVA